MHQMHAHGAVTFEERLRALAPALVLHTAALAWFVRVWLFHLSPAAAKLPGAKGFPWFFRYLTMYGFALQTVALAFSAVEDWGQLLGAENTGPAGRLADDLSCASFAGAHVVSLMFHAIQAATGGRGVFDPRGVKMPPWLSPTVHVLNSLVAWADVLVAGRRSFSPASEMLCCGLVVGYCFLIQACKRVNGYYPYPFMNKAKNPNLAAVLAVVVGMVIFSATHRAGSAVVGRARGVAASLFGHEYAPQWV